MLIGSLCDVFGSYDTRDSNDFFSKSALTEEDIQNFVKDTENYFYAMGYVRSAFEELEEYNQFLEELDLSFYDALCELITVIGEISSLRFLYSDLRRSESLFFKGKAEVILLMSHGELARRISSLLRYIEYINKYQKRYEFILQKSIVNSKEAL